MWRISSACFHIIAAGGLNANGSVAKATAARAIPSFFLNRPYSIT
jgi:hypothetical protein